jgi:nitrate/nitrite transporter NarK
LWTGVQNFAGNIGGVIAPAATGFAIASTGSYVSSFFIVGAVLVVGIVAYVFMLPSLTAVIANRDTARAPLHM